MFETTDKFWQRHPALLYAVFLYIGTAAALSQSPSLLIPFTLLSLPFAFILKHRDSPLIKRLGLGLLIMATGFFYAKSLYLLPEIPKEGFKGIGFFDVKSLSESSHYFGKQWIYKGSLEEFYLKNNGYQLIGRNLPCMIRLSGKMKQRPLADHHYKILGTLKQIGPLQYTFVPEKDYPWVEVEGSWNPSEKRFLTKEGVSTYIKNHFPEPRVAAFLTGLSTGQLDDKVLTFELGRFGLQHILAVSGFHFAIIASIFGFFLRLVVSGRATILLLMAALSSYFMFIGPNPSVMRAWITISIALGGCLLERNPNGLNSLGVAILAMLVIDPMMGQSVGFQLSASVAGSIIMFYPLFESLFRRYLRKRSLSQMTQMDSLNQHGYIILTWFRKALALSCAVNVVAAPLMLFFFQKFPFMSLLYNLFFPFMVSFSMFLLIIGSALSAIIPPLGWLIHYANHAYTLFLLNMVYHMPTSLDFAFRVASFDESILLAYLCGVFIAGVAIRKQLNDRRMEYRDLSYA